MNSLKSTKLAVIITDTKTAEAFKHKKDMLLEYRVDLNPSFTETTEIPKNAILTYRSEDEGGEGDSQGQNRRAIIQELMRMPNALIDFELKRDLNTLEDYLQRNGDPNRVIISSHDYSGSMEQSAKIYKKVVSRVHEKHPILRESAVHKFVGKPIDSLDLFLGIEELKSFPKRVVLGIGKVGEPSRTLPIGNQFVFGSVTKIAGIMDFSTLQNIRNCENPLFFGLIGKKLEHSLSPSIHSLLLKKTNLCGYYHLFPLKDENRVTPFFEFARRYGVTGLNVTFPYKEIAARYANRKTREVELSGAANTLRVEEETISAFNTDISGFTRTLIDHGLEKVDTAIIIGAGGAAKAVAYALRNLRIETYLYNRSRERFKAFPDELQQNIAFVEDTQETEAELYINTTPVGMDGNGSPTEFAPFPWGVKVAIDVAYSTKETGLIKTAKRKGIEAFDGKEMLFHQAVDSFEIWTGHSVDRQSLLEEWLMEVKGT